MVDVKANFSGSIPEYYDSCLGPALFEAYAEDLAQRLPARPPGDVLEIACGTGQVTRRLRERLDPACRLVATDLKVVEGLFPGDEEMRFRIPFEMHDPALLRQLLAGARFQEVRIETKRIQTDRVSARTVAVGQIRGTPRSLLLEKRGVPLDVVVEKVTAALAKIGGADPYRANTQAVVVEARAIA